ncbi:RNA polymerase sigma factor RpoH [Rickettsiales bacterium]|nr:RNA polymerase sigma factor RpoH [Rickettsiales bacterium]
MSTAALPVLSNETTLAGYLDKVNKFPYLTAEEEIELAKDWSENGDVDAAHKLVTSHLRLVVKMATSFKGYGLPILELISEGNIGLMHAVKKFDHKKGFRLSTYAMWWIRASMQEYILRSWSLVKIGTTAAQKKLFFNLRRLKGQLDKVDNTALSPEDVASIASELGVNQGDVIEMDSRISLSDKSLNDPSYSDDEPGELIDNLECSSQSHELVVAEREDFNKKKAIFNEALKILNEREQNILSQRRLSEPPATLEELSAEYNVSRERVRQIEARAVEKLQAKVIELSAGDN